ncbi:MAG: DUF2141 domain-containing protein [Bacteroidota bacterium]
MNGLLLWWALMLTAIPGIESGTLELQLQNIKSFSGCIRIAVYDNEEAFSNDGTVVWGKVVSNINSKNISLKVDDLPFGDYAIALYHDKNDNDQIDKNTFGIPTEPYAFSNNPKVKWKQPTFEESKFHFSKTNQQIPLILKKWSKH